MNVPNDISIISFDNRDFSSLLSPALTTFEEDSNLAAQLVEKMICKIISLYVDSENSKHSSFHVNMFALRFGLVPEERVEPCLNFIIAKGMVCSVYAAQFYLDTLFIHNRASEAVALLTADNNTSWLGMIRQGATITTESWNPGQKKNMSWAHPWGSSPANLIVRHLFGLRPTAPGWRKYEFEPDSGGIDSAEIRIKTPRGILNASFKHDENGQLVKRIKTINTINTSVFSSQTETSTCNI